MAQMKCQSDNFGFKTKEEHRAHIEKRMNNANSSNHREYWRLLLASTYYN